MKHTRYWLLTLLVVATGLLAGCSKHGRFRRAMAAADRDYQEGKYDRAELGYMRARMYVPMDPAAIRQLGLIYSYEGRNRLALGYLVKAVELDPTRADTRLKLAESWLIARQWPQSRQQVLWVLGVQPTNEDALFLLMDAITSSNELVESVRLLSNLRAQNPDAAGFHLAAGWLAVRGRDLDTAEQEFRTALKLNTNSVQSRIALGKLLWARGETGPAGELLQTAAQIAPIDSDALLTYANFLYQTGSRDAARQTLEEASRRAPFYIPALSMLADIAFAGKRYDDCLALVDRIRQTDPDNYAAWIMSGHVLVSKHQPAQAVEEFERMAKSTAYGTAPEVSYELALAQVANDDPIAAAASLHDALSRNTNYLAAALLLAELNIRGGDPLPAITSLNGFVKKFPRDQKIYLTLGRAYLAQGKPDDAAGVYRQMQPLFPEDPQIPMLLGNVLAGEGDIRGARRAFEQAMDISPGYPPAVERLVSLDLRERNPAAATARVQAELQEHRSDSSLARLHALQGRIYRSQKQFDKAEAEYKQAIELDPHIDSIYLALSEVYVASNRQQEALKGLEDLMARTNDVAAIMQIGKIHDIMKDYPAARDAYEKLLTMDPKFAPALNNLAYLYSERLVNLDRAYEMAEQARKLSPDDPDTADTLGWILFKRGDYARARSLLEESAEKSPDEGEIQFHLGMARYMQADEDAARDALTRAVQSDDDFPGKAEARERLAIMSIDAATATPAQVAQLEKARADRPDDPVALVRTAAIDERNGAADKALPIYEALVAKYPRNVFVLSHLANLYGQHDPAKALELAKSAHNLAPDNAQISRILGQLVFRSGANYKWALSLYQQAAPTLGSDPAFQYEFGWAYYDAGQPAPAVAAMHRALDASLAAPQSTDATRLIKLVGIADDATQPGAADTVRQELVANPDYVPARMASAAVHEQQGDYPGARDIYQAVLAQNPLMVPAARRLAILYAGPLNSSDPKACDIAKAASEAYPDDLEVTKAYGILSYRTGENSRAANMLADYSRSRPDDGLAKYYLGKAQFSLKRTRESKAALQQALALKLPSELEQDARQVLAEINK